LGFLTALVARLVLAAQILDAWTARAGLGFLVRHSMDLARRDGKCSNVNVNVNDSGYDNGVSKGMELMMLMLR
jgi:hypothetical protein